ncbi:MAG: regulatory protein GemA [Phenylobacterium sp.]|uniref:regulatory protein GemA n=1 Tax=Phenylobacterium sp. TaxID=1871053 RepID=UPI003918ABAA
MTAPARVLDGHRRALLAKVHLGAKELRLDEETRRDILERVTRHRSSADCTDAQLAAVLDEYRRLGWKPAAPAVRTGAAPDLKRARRPADHPVAKKARALWISLHQLGVVRDPSERALEAFGRRQLGVDRLQWADQSQGYRLVEALKAMAERAGWSQQIDRRHADRETWVLKARLVNAQLEKLGRPFLAVHGLNERDLDRHAKELAAEIWAAGD